MGGYLDVWYILEICVAWQCCDIAAKPLSIENWFLCVRHGLDADKPSQAVTSCSYPQRLFGLLVDLSTAVSGSTECQEVGAVPTSAKRFGSATARQRPMAQWCRTTLPSTCRPTPKFGRRRDRQIAWANQMENVGLANGWITFSFINYLGYAASARYLHPKPSMHMSSYLTGTSLIVWSSSRNRRVLISVDFSCF